MKNSSKSEVRVLLLENIHQSAKDAFLEAGYVVDLLPGALGEDELIERIKGVSILGIRSASTISERLLSHADKLVAIGAFCIGTNQIDLEVTAKKGIAVFNAPFQNTRSVVELAIAEIIALKRQLIGKNERTHQGIWDKSAIGSHEIRGLKLGIVGYGRIGSQLSVVAENLGMQVQYYDLEDTLSMSNAVRCGSLNELLKTSDVVTVHVDGRPENKGLIGEKEFRRMKNDSLFLNLSRGMVVDIDALKSHLVSGHIAGAAIDVYPKEPKIKGEAFVSPLQGVPNVILTPHVAGSTLEAQESIGQYVSNKLIRYMRSGASTMNVSLPSISLSEGHEVHRLSYVHQNIPGVLASLNTILSEDEINVVAQNLATANDIGYVLTDSTAPFTVKTTMRLQKIGATIRIRTIN
jgi:D-3-phosphoglycerate dehydrogenase